MKTLLVLLRQFLVKIGHKLHDTNQKLILKIVFVELNIIELSDCLNGVFQFVFNWVFCPKENKFHFKRNLSLSALPDDPSGDPGPPDDQRGDLQSGLEFSNPIQAGPLSSAKQQRN